MEEIRVEGARLAKTDDSDVFRLEVFSEGDYKLEAVRQQYPPVAEKPEEAEVTRGEIQEALRLVDEYVTGWRKGREPFPPRDAPKTPSDLVNEAGLDALRERVGFSLGEFLYSYTPVRKIFFEYSEEVRDLIK